MSHMYEFWPGLSFSSCSRVPSRRYESVVTKLYSGNQCCLCSMRFTTAQTDMYADHLDWHFRQNHAGKVASKKVTHRRWYYSLTVRRHTHTRAVTRRSGPCLTVCSSRTGSSLRRSLTWRSGPRVSSSRKKTRRRCRRTRLLPRRKSSKASEPPRTKWGR